MGGDGVTTIVGHDVVDNVERAINYESTGEREHLIATPVSTQCSNFAIVYVNNEAIPIGEPVFATGIMAHSLDDLLPHHAELRMTRTIDLFAKAMTGNLLGGLSESILNATVLIDTSQKDAALLADSVISGFHLTKTQLASIAGVSRQSVHGWLRGAQDMSPATYRRLTHLDHLLTALANAGVRRPGAALAVPIFEGRRSAADLIRDDEWDEVRDTALLVGQATTRPRPASVDIDTERVMREVDRAGRFLSRDE